MLALRALLLLGASLVLVASAGAQEVPARLAALTSEGIRVLESAEQRLVPNTQDVQTFAWDRGGRHLIATTGAALVRIDAVSGKRTSLGAPFADVRFPDVAPRSGRIAGATRASRASEDQRWTLVVVEADGSGARELGPGYDPCWSADERELYFEAFAATGPELWAIDLETLARRCLFDDGIERYTVGRGPDAHSLSWSSHRHLHAGAPGAEVTCFSPAEAYDRFASFSPDGQHLLFFREDAGERGIVLRDLARGAERRLAISGRADLAAFAPGAPPPRTLADFERLSRSSTSARDLASICRLDAERYRARLVVLEDDVHSAEHAALVLPGVTELDPQEARLLAESGARQIVLPDLDRLDAAVAAELARFRANAEHAFLALDGVAHVEATALVALATSRAWGVSLGGLATLDREQASALARFRIGWLDLRGLRQLDAECARILVEGDLKFVDLRGLEPPAGDVRGELERAGSRFLLAEPRR